MEDDALVYRNQTGRRKTHHVIKKNQQKKSSSWDQNENETCHGPIEAQNCQQILNRRRGASHTYSNREWIQKICQKYNISNSNTTCDKNECRRPE